MDKRPVEAGRVRLRKVVRTEREEVPVPVMREEPVVGKETRVTDEVRVNKDVETETRRVGDEVRREDVKVDREESRGRKQRG